MQCFAVGRFLAVEVADSCLGVALPPALISRMFGFDRSSLRIITVGVVGTALAIRMPLFPSQCCMIPNNFLGKSLSCVPPDRLRLLHELQPAQRFPEQDIVALAGRLEAGLQDRFLRQQHLQGHLTNEGRCRASATLLE